MSNLRQFNDKEVNAINIATAAGHLPFVQNEDTHLCHMSGDTLRITETGYRVFVDDTPTGTYTTFKEGEFAEALSCFIAA